MEEGTEQRRGVGWKTGTGYGRGAGEVMLGRQGSDRAYGGNELEWGRVSGAV